MVFRVYKFLASLSSNTLVILIFLFLAAAIFRLFFLDLIEFKFDEAFNVYQLTNFFAHPTLNFHSGLSSSGMHNFPLLHYLLILVSLFSRDPQYISFIIALVNTALVPIFYLITKKYYSNFTSFFSALLLASSPWAILYSRKIWHPDLILLFLIPIFYILHQIVLEKRNKYQWLLFTLMVLLIQQHFSGFFVLVAITTILIFNKIKLNVKQVIVGISLGIIPALPYIFYNISSSPFCADCVVYMNFQGTPKPFDFEALIRPWQITNGLYFENVLGQDYSLFQNTYPQIKILNNIFLLGFLFPIIGMVVIFIKDKKYLFLPIYFLTVLGLYIITKTPARMYYFIIMLPVTLILPVIAFDYLKNLTKQIWIKLAVTLILLIFVISNFIFQYYFLRFISNKQVINGDYGPIYTVTKTKIQPLLKEYTPAPYYNQLKSYAYLFAQDPNLHSRLGEFFIQQNERNFAVRELEKALENYPDDINARANLTYVYIATGKFNDAEKHLGVLSTKDSTVSAQLKKLLNNVKNGVD